MAPLVGNIFTTHPVHFSLSAHDSLNATTSSTFYPHPCSWVFIRRLTLFRSPCPFLTPFFSVRLNSACSSKSSPVSLLLQSLSCALAGGILPLPWPSKAPWLLLSPKHQHPCAYYTDVVTLPPLSGMVILSAMDHGGFHLHVSRSC